MFQQFFWPDIQTRTDAKNLSQRASVFAFFIAAVTAGAVYLQTHHKIQLMPDLDAASYIDAAAFAVIGFFLLKCSRLAAVSGLVLYSLDQAILIQQNGYRFSILPLLIFFGFVSAVRATFDYHAMKSGESKDLNAPVADTSGASAQSAARQAPKMNSRVRQILLAVLALGVFAAAGWVAYHNLQAVSKNPRNTAPHKTASALPDVIEKVSRAAQSEPVKGARKSFRLRDGSTVTGVVTYEDDVYATVETLTGPVTVIMEDVKSADA